MKLKDILNKEVSRNRPKLYEYFDIILDKLSVFDKKVDIIFKKCPLLCAFFAGLLSSFSFKEVQLSIFLMFSFYIFFKILYNFFVEKRFKKGLLLGYIYGFGMFSNLFSWMLSIHEFGIGDRSFEIFLSILGFTLTSSFLSLLMSLTSYLSLKLAYNKISLYLFFSLFYTFFELTESYFVDLVPFLILSYGTAGFKYFIQFGSIVGSSGLTFLFLIIMSLLMFRKYYKYGIFIFLFCSFYGIYKIHLKRNYKIPKEKFDITVVQTNFSENGRHSYYEYCCDDFAEMAKSKDIVNPTRKKLLIGPETLIGFRNSHINYLVEKSLNIDGIKDLIKKKNETSDLNKKKKYEEMIKNRSNNVVVCTGYYERNPDKMYNSYHFFNYDYEKDDFRRLSKYYKRYLIPLSERCPYLILKFFEFLARHFKFFKNIYEDYKHWELSAGDGKNTIDIEGISPFAMELCSDIIPSGVTLYDSYKPTWILSTMNFHVFHNSKKNTFLSRLCYLCGKFRAIEFNRPNVMCINFGYSCILDCNGEPLRILDPKTAGIIEFEMPLKYDVSLFSIWRYKLIYLLLIILFAFLFINKKKRYLD